MKQWEYRERARQVLARETGYVRKPHGGRLRVALAFPNTYCVGMSSLGFQTVYRLFNDLDDVVCERVFLPPKQELRAQLACGTPLLTLESQTPVADFDVLAFSVSFEWDYTNVVTMLRLAGLAPRASARPRARSAGRDRRRRDVREPRTAGAVRRRDRRRRRRGARCPISIDAFCASGRSRASSLRAARVERGFYMPVVLRRALRRRRHDCGVRAEARQRRARGGEEGGGEERGTPGPAGDVDLHARHRVRVALPDRGRARLREPVPLLLGRLQLPAGAGVSGRPHPRARARGAGSTRAAPGSCRSRSATTPRSSGSSTGLLEMGYSISPASLRLDDLTEPIVRLLRAERRDARSRSRPRPARIACAA